MTDVTHSQSQSKARAQCVAEGCERPGRYAGTGYCAMHQVRFRKTGDAGQPGPLRLTDPAADVETKLRFYGWDVIESGCWIWRGPFGRAGGPFNYGVVRVNGRTQRVHRLAQELWNGPIPEGHVVCHRCDTPECMNPSHLFAGTQADNIDDMWNKGRGVNGERQHCATLTADDVRAMRRLRAEGVEVRSLAADYGIHVRQVYKIINREQWTHVHDEDAKGSPS